MAREGKVAKLSIVGDIGWDYFGVSYQGFKNMLKDVGDANVVEVEINSNGGVVTDGVAIMNSLAELDASVHVYVNGMAASIASVIAMAGDKIFIPSNSLLMVHKPLNGLFGNADDMRKMAEDLDKFETALVNSYMRHFKGTEAEIKALMTDETFLTADEVEDKFNNVTVMKQELEAVAHCDPVAILGDIGIPTETLLDRAVNAVRAKTQPTTATPKEDDMPISPEDMKAIADMVVASLKEDTPAEEVVDEVPAEEVKEETPDVEIDVVVNEIAFEGDMDSAEDVQAHLAKVQLAEVKASADMTTSAGVMAYHKALSKLQGKEEAPAGPQSNVTPSTQVSGQEINDFSPEAISASVARMTKKK